VTDQELAAALAQNPDLLALLETDREV